MQTSNIPQWDKRRAPYFEVWYWKLNTGPGGPALWIRLSILSSKDKKKSVAEAVGVYFKPNGRRYSHVAIKETHTIEKYSWGDDEVRVGECFWMDGLTAGRIGLKDGSDGSNSEIRWDLSFEPNRNGFDHVPSVLKTFGLNATSLLTTNPDLKFRGRFWVNGSEHVCQGARGMQGHLFGKKSADRWAWAHCNLADDGTPFVFEAITARVRIGGIFSSSPLSIFFFEYEGKRYCLNSLREAFEITSHYTLDGWDFIAEKEGLRFEGHISTHIPDFVGVRLTETDGSRLFCHNSKVSNLRLQIFKGSKLLKEIRATHACAFECVSAEADPRVKILL